MRILVSLLTLTLISCSCCAPSLDSFEHELADIRDVYNLAEKFEPIYCIGKACNEVRIAHYNAAAALTIAVGEPSAKNVREAREKVIWYASTEGVH